MSSTYPTARVTLSWFRRILAVFSGGYTRIKIEHGEIKLDAALGQEPWFSTIEQVENVTFHRSWLTSRFVIDVQVDHGLAEPVSIAGLSVGKGDDLLRVFDDAAVAAASNFENHLRDVDERIVGVLRGDRFIDRGELVDFHSELLDLIGNAPGAYVRARISYEAEQIWKQSQTLSDVNELTALRQAANHKFIANLTRRVATEAYGSVLVDLEDRFGALFSGGQYVRKIDASLPYEELTGVLLDMPVESMIEGLAPSAMGVRERLLTLVDPEAFEERRLLANRYYCSSLTLRVAAESYNHAVESLDGRIQRLFLGESWLRASQAELPFEEVAGVAQDMPTTEILDHISPAAAVARERLLALSNDEHFEERRNAVNERYASRSSESAAQAARSVIGRELTEEQAVAVVTDEDATLVFAGAGSGKTAVIVSKVAHLVENEGALLSEILVLAFNDKAVKELEQRLAARYAEVSVRTFHRFGKRIVDDVATVRASVSTLASDSDRRRSAMVDYLQTLLRDPVLGVALRDYLFYNRWPSRSPFEFASRAEYFSAVGKGLRRTLSGDMVKSHEELQIANFLTLNGIEFTYEKKYEVATADSRYQQYQPDFHIGSHDLYIEHFAIDRQGQPPKHWTPEERERYRKGIEWKREVHRANKTRLLETYSWQRGEGILRSELGRQLQAWRVEVRPISIEEQISKLTKEFKVSDVVKLFDAFLNHQKSSSLSIDELRKRADAAGDVERAHAFLNVFEEVERWYATSLGEEIDFYDMINRAAVLLRNEEWRHSYKYVLVDEFQDISRGRMALLEALHRTGVAFFVVGDDWQSIYRFAGSDVSVVNTAVSSLGKVRTRELAQTFRYGRGILAPSSSFVQQNPSQSQRTLRANDAVNDHGIIAVVQTPPSDGPAQARLRGVKARIGRDRSDAALQELRPAEEAAREETVNHTLSIVFADIMRLTVDEERRPSILVLGRYNFNRPKRLPRNSNIKFSTIHSAKGQEADFTIVLDLRDGSSGFPSQREDDPLLDLVAPPSEPFSFAEERRLFYVALTRSRRATYLLVDADEPSRFVIELLRRNGGDIRRIGNLSTETAEICYRCGSGVLVESISRKNMRCSNSPQCDALYPACACQHGFLVRGAETIVCTNVECEEKTGICPECGIGILVRKRGRWGEFWGCSEFPRIPPCRHTQNRPP